MAMVRGRTIFADITNVSLSMDDGADDAGSCATVCSGVNGDRTRLQKASILHSAPTSLQARVSESAVKSLELAGRLQAEHSEAINNILSRSASNGRTRRSSSQSGLRAAAVIPSRRSSNGRNNRRYSPGPVAGSSGGAGCTPKSFEPEPRRGLTHAPEEQLPQRTLLGSNGGADTLGTRRLSRVGAPLTATSSPASLSACAKDFLSEQPAEHTQLAALFEGMRVSQLGKSPEDQVDIVLADLVDTVLQYSHKESQRHVPAPEQLMECLGNSQRSSIIEWLVQACDIMRLQDGVLY